MGYYPEYPLNRRPIFVIGYMACGKTTFGYALARALKADFYDLDFYIEQRFRKTVTRIFEEEGEEAFREKESKMLREVGEFENVVIACGGGTPCFNDNMPFMLEHGTVVWLEASPECMLRRLMINNSRRPLMAGKSFEEMKELVIKGLNERVPYYSKADIRFSGEELEDKKQIDSTVEAFLKILSPQNF